MRYYKKFDTFINEAAFKSDHDFNIVDMLSPIFKGIGGFFDKTKLNSIQTGLDNYLSNQYNEFLKEKKTNNDEDTKKTNVENLSKEDDLYVNGPKETKKETKVEPTNSDTQAEVETESGTRTENNTNVESETVTNTETESETTSNTETQTKDKEEEKVQPQEQSQPQEATIKESPIVVNKRSQYVTGDEMTDCEEMLNTYYNENDIEATKTGIENYTRSMRHAEKIIKQQQEELKPFKDAKTKASKEIVKHKPGSVEYDRIQYIIDNSNKKIKPIEDRIEQKTMDFENSKWWVEQFQNNLNLIEKNQPKANESLEIKPDNWDNKKIEALRKTINPFQIDEFFIRAEIISARSKNDSLKGRWQLLLNEVAKKWYWAYGDIKTLKNPTSSYTKDTKDLALSSMAIETIYPNSKKVLVKEVYANKDEFFVLKNVDSMTLLKKKEFEDKKCVFYILGEISVNENKKLALKPFDLKKSNRMTFTINKKKYEIYLDSSYNTFLKLDGASVAWEIDKKDTNAFPVIIIKDNFINDVIELLNTDIQSFSNNDFKQILKDSNINSFVLPEKNKEEK